MDDKQKEQLREIARWFEKGTCVLSTTPADAAKFLYEIAGPEPRKAGWYWVKKLSAWGAAYYDTVDKCFVYHGIRLSQDELYAIGPRIPNPDEKENVN